MLILLKFSHISLFPNSEVFFKINQEFIPKSHYLMQFYNSILTKYFPQFQTYFRIHPT